MHLKGQKHRTGEVVLELGVKLKRNKVKRKI
jgi:hypothetical protein